jgi:hypothetical protein
VYALVDFEVAARVQVDAIVNDHGTHTCIYPMKTQGGFSPTKSPLYQFLKNTAGFWEWNTGLPEYLT